MTLLFARGLWGMAAEPLAQQCDRIAAAGFTAVEAFIPLGDPSWQLELRHALQASGLQLIAQLHSRRDNRQRLGQEEDAFARIDQLSDEAAQLHPLMLNWHAGSDHEDAAWNHSLVAAILSAAQQRHLNTVVETHRGRCTWNAKITADLLQQFPELRLCADFSHWCCVHESLLERFEPELRLAISRTDLIHARVGYSQGPQVSHWRADEHQQALQAHLAWWDAIVARKHAGDQPLIICPEFGPTPYQPTLPFTNQAVSDNWELNDSMMHFLRERYL